MPFQNLNLYLFHIFNVPEQASHFMMSYATFIAHDLIYIVFFSFICAWLIGNIETKKNIFKAFIFTSITLFISEVLSFVLDTPRPFVMNVGETILTHAPTGSFPSNHMSIFSGLAFSYYFSSQRQLGKLLIAVAWLVAWARVYVGVHFPLDMCGAFFFAFVVNISGLKLWNMYQNQLMTWVMFIHLKIFSFFIDKGLIQ